MTTATKLSKIAKTASTVETHLKSGQNLFAMETFDKLVELIDNVSEEMANLTMTEKDEAELAKVFNQPPKNPALALKRKVVD